MTLSQRHMDELVEVARTVARREVLPRFRKLAPGEIATKSGPTDLVTVADRAAEAAIRLAVSRILPDAVVIGEEAVSETPDLVGAIGSSDTCVIVDPIDGTGNYVAGLATFGMILAVTHRFETVFGLLYDPVEDDWMFALKGQGAWHRRSDGSLTALRTRPNCALADAEGFVAFKDYAPAERAAVLRGFGSVSQVQDLRCSCHEYRLLASGKADFLRSYSLKPWDHAAGILVLEEAGGWALINGTQRYSPSAHDGKIIAASCEDVGQRVAKLASELP